LLFASRATGVPMTAKASGSPTPQSTRIVTRAATPSLVKRASSEKSTDALAAWGIAGLIVAARGFRWEPQAHRG